MPLLIHGHIFNADVTVYNFSVICSSLTASKIVIHARARICTRSRSPGIDYKESIRQAEIRFLDSLNGLQIRTLFDVGGGGDERGGGEGQASAYERHW